MPNFEKKIKGYTQKNLKKWLFDQRKTTFSCVRKLLFAYTRRADKTPCNSRSAAKETCKLSTD